MNIVEAFDKAREDGIKVRPTHWKRGWVGYYESHNVITFLPNPNFWFNFWRVYLYQKPYFEIDSIHFNPSEEDYFAEWHEFTDSQIESEGKAFEESTKVKQ